MSFKKECLCLKPKALPNSNIICGNCHGTIPEEKRQPFQLIPKEPFPKKGKRRKP